MPLIIPSPDVRYRIQNVDFGTILERRFNVDLLMRAVDDELKQQWYFRKISDGIFEIRNADDQDYMVEASVDGSGYSATCQKAVAGSAQRLQWKLVDLGPKGYYILNTNFGRNNIFLLCEANDDLPNLSEDPSIRRSSTTITKEKNYRWRILEDSPSSLPDGGASGEYVIQTLKGYLLHPEGSAGSSQTLSVAVEDLAVQHKWEIVDLGNGKATIKNGRDGAFMDVQQVGSDGDWTPVLSNTTQAPQWDIKKIGEFGYSVTVLRRMYNSPDPTPQRLALTIKNNVVTLKRMTSAHNQLWLIEAIDADSFDLPQPQQPQSQGSSQPQGGSLPQSQPELDPQSPQPQPQPQSQLPEIAEGLQEGEYRLLNESGYSVYFDGSYRPILNRTAWSYASTLSYGAGAAYFQHSDSGKYLQHTDYYNGYVGGYQAPTLGDVSSRKVFLVKSVGGPPHRYQFTGVSGKLVIAWQDVKDGTYLDFQDPNPRMPENVHTGHSVWQFIPKA